MTTSSSNGIRPIAVRFGALGDMVMFRPVLEALAARWGAPVDLITSGAWTPAVLGDLEAVGDLVQMPGTRRRPFWLSPAKRRLVDWLTARQEAPVFIFERNQKFDEFLVRAKVPSDRIARLPASVHHGHDIDLQVSLARTSLAPLRPIADDLQPGCPALPVSIEAREGATAWLAEEGFDRGPVVLVQPGNKKTMRAGRLDRASNRKYWPIEHWGTLIQGVRETLPDAMVLVCGVPAEQAFAAEIAEAGGLSANHAVADRLPLERLFAVQTLAHSMISVDTGPAHTAAAVGCPATVFFGQTNPIRHLPRGSAPVVGVLHDGLFDPEDPHWTPVRLEDVAPERVLEGWRRLCDSIRSPA
ncbi:MAG: glycosyltransferase family 9 protein [Pseudomonadota bacterium]